MSSIKALISDADGTLINTVQLIRHGQYEAAKKYLTKHGIPVDEIPTYETYDALLSQVVGGATRSTTEKTLRLLYSASPHHLDSLNFDELHATLNPIQDKLAPKYVQSYSGLTSFLKNISEHNIKLAIFSSGSAHHIVRNFGIALPELDLVDLYKDRGAPDQDKLRIFEDKFSQHFSIPGFTVVSSEDTGRHKPEPDSLLLAMNRLAVQPSEVAVLGDHKVDMQAAFSAEVDVRIGITHGFDDSKTLGSHGATHIVDSLDEASQLITSL